MHLKTCKTSITSIFIFHVWLNCCPIVENRIYNTGLIFYDLKTNRKLLPPTISVSRGRSLNNFPGSIWSTFGQPCKCSMILCNCCVGIINQKSYFNEKVCANVTYGHHNNEIQLDMVVNDKATARYGMLARNPSPFCIPIMLNMPMAMCVQLSNIAVNGNNLNMCMDFMVNMGSLEFVEMHFQCMQVGAQGLQWVGPDGQSVLPSGLKLPNIKNVDDNDENDDNGDNIDNDDYDENDYEGDAEEDYIYESLGPSVTDKIITTFTSKNEHTENFVHPHNEKQTVSNNLNKDLMSNVGKNQISDNKKMLIHMRTNDNRIDNRIDNQIRPIEAIIQTNTSAKITKKPFISIQKIIKPNMDKDKNGIPSASTMKSENPLGVKHTMMIITTPIVNNLFVTAKRFTNKTANNHMLNSNANSKKKIESNTINGQMALNNNNNNNNNSNATKLSHKLMLTMPIIN